MTGSSNDHTRQPNPRRRFRFSLGYLCVFTAIVAAWTAAYVARQKNLELLPQRDTLVSLAGRLNVDDPNELDHVSLPKITGDFESWDVHVPVGNPQELRLHCGSVSVGGLPQEFESIPLSPGRHRIVFRALDRVEELYRYQVYIDGKLVLENQMGCDWMPSGWRQASGYNPRRGAEGLYLDGSRYMPIVELGNGEYFNGQLDQWSTELGYLLWIDQVGRTPEPISAFLGLGDEYWQGTVGLRDGLRCEAFTRTSLANYDLPFAHPAARTYDPVLNVELEFLIDQKVVLSNLATSFAGWKLSDSADQLEEDNKIRGFTNDLNWERDPAIVSRSAFLHGVSDDLDGVAPVVELRWSKERPNEVGFRLPKVPANAAFTSWRLRCTEGVSHLWRIIESGDLKQDSRKVSSQTATDAEAPRIEVALAGPDNGRQSVQWRTDISKPLQVYQRNKSNRKALAGNKLFGGKPFKFGCEFSASADTKVWATCEDKFSDTAKTPILGGHVFDQVVIERGVVETDDANPAWIWLSAEPR